MDQIDIILEDLVHLARLALTGSKDEIDLIIKRLSKRTASHYPDVSEKLQTLLKGQQTRAFRNSNMNSVPVDRDSRLNLLKIEYPIEVPTAIVLQDDVRFQMDSLVSERKKSSTLVSAGFSPVKSALFSGKPGVGKTLMAKTIAKNLDVPLLTLDLSAVMSSFLGRTGANLKSVFEYAKGMKCVLLLDEIDAVAKKRNDNAELGELKRLVNVLIQEIDEWPSSNLLIGATNHPELLDPAIWRRFDVVIRFPDPDRGQTAKLISNILSGDERAREFSPLLAALLSHLSLSEIENEINKTRKYCFLNSIPFADGISSLVEKHLGTLDHNEKIDVATLLFNSGVCSQRKAHELTGVSRDTIRKNSVGEVNE
ncbi:AAA family ATPase [Bdellovibrio bacteriovorus]|uniref:AAA family ATPase n=1 Tax=Bdellovibrio bacteriovorus TaxID=959 RepID=UPI003AA88C05